MEFAACGFQDILKIWQADHPFFPSVPFIDGVQLLVMCLVFILTTSLDKLYLLTVLPHIQTISIPAICFPSLGYPALHMSQQVGICPLQRTLGKPHSSLLLEANCFCSEFCLGQLMFNGGNLPQPI